MKFRSILATGFVCAALSTGFLYGAETVSAATTSSLSTYTSLKIINSVNMRDKPNTSARIVKLVKSGQVVKIINHTSSYWVFVEDATGQRGYLSTSNKFVEGTGGPSTPAPPVAPTTPNVPTPSPDVVTSDVITAGLKYLGTPYKYGADRKTTSFFDCSSFVRRAYLDATNLTLPSDSRKQGEYVRARGTDTTNLSELQVGDLMFFMSYKGSGANAYSNVAKSKERITHVGIYMGNGNMLHTYSTASGGVRVDKVGGNSWEYRFMYGGSVR